jgi:hypothetical protein
MGPDGYMYLVDLQGEQWPNKEEGRLLVMTEVGEG